MIQQREQRIATVISYSITDCINGTYGICSVASAGAEKTEKTDGIERDARIEQERKQREANSHGTMLLLRVQLIEYHDKYMRLGEIPSYAYENFNEMYDAYHKLGGNGMVTKMKQEIEELHLKKKGQSNYE